MLTAAQVAERLGLGGSYASWLAKLAAAQCAILQPLDERALDAALDLLGVASTDAAEIKRTMPAAKQDPEAWWLLERSRHLLARGLANRENNSEPPPALPEALILFPAHLIVVTLDAIRECHEQFGIPDDISRETLSYLGRAMAAYRALHGRAGLQLTRWDWLRFAGTLFQAGRLTVIPYRLRTTPEAGPLFWYDDENIARLGPGFRRGDAALSLHIPADEPLTPQTCGESLNRMRTAFARIYPGEPLRIATCTSWLLDDQLAEYLPADSNIIAFQRRFHLVPGVREDDEGVLRSVFGAGGATELDALPRNTTLQRAVVDHLRNGRHWRMRTGWLALGDNSGDNSGDSPGD